MGGTPVVYEEEQASTNQTAKMLAEQGASHGHLWSLSVRYPAEAEEAVPGIRQRAAASG